MNRAELVERVARFIDPEAFGLPERDSSCDLGGYLTDRDEARARANSIITEFMAVIREHAMLARELGV